MEICCLKCNRIFTRDSINTTKFDDRVNNNKVSIFYSEIQYKQYTNLNDGCVYCSSELQIMVNDINEIVERICLTAFKYQAKIMGGFVRDYLVPKLEFEEKIL